MKSFPLVLLGILINSVGLCFLGNSIIHHAMANGAAAAGLFDGAMALILINLGVCLIAWGLQRGDRS
jgi:hypothetical protein